MSKGETEGAQRETSRFAGAIGRVTSILAIPYGYTVTLSSAVLAAVIRLGTPSELEVLFFVVGAVLGFVLLAAIGRPHLADEIPMRVPWVIVFNLFPIVAALVVIAVPVYRLGRGPGYFSYSFVATTVYVLCLGAFIRIRDRVSAV